MVASRKSLCLVLTLCLLAWSLPVLAQDAAADQAKALLLKGVEQFRAMDYKGSQQTLLQVKRDDLSADADKKVLDDYITRLPQIVKSQQAARDAVEAADNAVKAGDFAKAKEGYALAADNAYLPDAEKQNARAKLALVDKRVELAAAAGATSMPAPPATVTPAPPATVTPAPAAPPAPVAADKAGDAAAARAQKARQWLAAGKSALDNGDYAMAKTHFQRAVDLDPSLEEAKALLAQATQLSGTSEESSIRGRLIANRKIAEQEALIEYEGDMQRSRELAAKDTDSDLAAASEAAKLAQNVLDNNKSLFNADQYRNLSAEAQNQITFVANKQQQLAAAAQTQREEAISKATKERIEAERQQRGARIDALAKRAQTLTSEKNYASALEVVEQILELDPQNKAAAAQVDLLRQMVILRGEREYDRAKQYETQKNMVDLRESEVPWYEFIKYPKNWREITMMRESVVAGSSAESPADRLIRQKLKQRLPRLQFSDIPFENVIQFLRDTSGLNIHPNWNAMPGAREAKINISLQDVTIEKALRLILDDVQVQLNNIELRWTLDEGVIKISTKDDINRDRPTLVYDVRDLLIRVPNFQAPAVTLTNQNGTGGNNVQGVAGAFLQNNGTNAAAEGNIPTKDEIIKKVADAIAMTVDPENWAQGPLTPNSAGSGGSIRELQGHLIITNTRETHEKVRQLLAQLREARALQISIEARFILISSGFLENIGLDLDFYFNVGSNLGSTRTTDPWTGAVVPTTGAQSGWGNNRPGTDKFTPMGFVQNSAASGGSDFTNMVGQKTTVPNSIGSTVTSDAMTLSGVFLDDIQVNFFIRATQAHQSTKSLTAPRLTLFNGQRAYITVGTDQAYVSDLTPVVSDNATTFQPTVGVVRSGTVLDVEATVSADRRYVTLTLRPQVSVLNGFDKYFTTVLTVDANGTPQTGIGYIQLPNVTSQTLETTVSVPDGGTLLLGGQKLSGEIEREMGVPLLSKIPVINRAFNNRGFVRDEQTLLILVRPKIIIQSEQERLQGFEK